MSQRTDQQILDLSILSECHSIRIDTPNGYMTFNLPAILETPLDNVKKVFRLVRRSVNDDAVAVLDEYIPAYVAQKFGRWETTSRKFQNEYRDPAMAKERGEITRKKDLIHLKAKNKRMLAAVSAAKRAFERSQKLEAIWGESK